MNNYTDDRDVRFLRMGSGYAQFLGETLKERGEEYREGWQDGMKYLFLKIARFEDESILGTIRVYEKLRKQLEAKNEWQKAYMCERKIDEYQELSRALREWFPELGVND